MILYRRKKNEHPYQKYLVPKPILMLLRRRFIDYYEKAFGNTIVSLRKEKGIINLNMGGLEVSMNIGCCEIAVVLAVANIITLAIFAGYTVKLRTRQIILEKKNGKEQREINQLKRSEEHTSELQSR